MISGQTARSRRARRPDLDRTARRYFVYFLLDATGTPLYIGRSCNVAARICAHASEATAQVAEYDRCSKREWFPSVRSVTMVGPFTWDGAVQRERAEIERAQPVGNTDLTVRDRRPAIAARSARRRIRRSA